ncbi:hypothetical protein IQ266_19430 [filamentous cyanobacterium LEGE 11480]|uniref:Uncharacterized protein n=1 Tax=Romeriopsis navalis LEGE 11480 TaxID=2777977 RepID=A0A928VNR9_9CYAN|nr:hypothetical protein [Romeriopsis navalis]MBE9031911.1 hypothetical protein [Romeriopsis navalis LEGE 11480]
MQSTMRYTVILSLSVLAFPLLNACSKSTQTPAVSQSVTVPAANASTPDASASTAATVAAKSTKATATPNHTAPSSSLAAGDYCYEYASKTSTAHAKVTVSGGNQVSGEMKGREHNEAASYYTSFAQTGQGTLTGNQAKLDIKTQIEGTNQASQETWTVTKGQLNTERATLQPINCAQFGKLPKPPQPGNTDSYTKPTNKRISFAKGASSTVISDGAVRGEWHTYLINAAKGQTLNMNITAVENNATFEVKSPTGQSLPMNGDTALNQVLPTTGDYQISVGPTRGNASYTMTVEIK